MTILSGEQAVLTTLQSAVELFRSDLSTFVSDIYGFETEQVQSDILTWWQNTQNQLTIQIGYSSQPVAGIAWNVVIGADEEITGQQPIGQVIDTEVIGSSGTQTSMSVWNSSYVVNCLGPGQDWLRWSQMLCKWALAYFRATMQEQYGLYDQRISAGRLQPTPGDLNDMVQFHFMRSVVLWAHHADTWNVTGLPVITSVQPLTIIPNSEMEE